MQTGAQRPAGSYGDMIPNALTFSSSPTFPITSRERGNRRQALFRRQVITRFLGIHLTGLDDLSPRAIRRRSLQAGRMSALSRRLGRNSLWALAHNKVLVTNRSMRDSKLQDPIE